MAMMYRAAKLPPDRELVARVADATGRLHDKLAALDVNPLTLSDYNKHYVERYQRKLYSNLQKFAYVMLWALAGSPKRIAEMVLLEYGGGAGILSLLARECGVGTVIYNDIYDVSCADAETIARVTDNRADHYVCGQVDEVSRLLERDGMSCDVLVSSDVIEHVYSMGEFLTGIRQLSDGHLSVGLSSHANPLNPYVRRLLMKKQREVEYEDRRYTPGHKKRDNLQSYRSIRMSIVRECSDEELPADEIEKLTVATRGMMAPDIRAAVARYVKTREMPLPIDHPTNTCDPLTGNWADRLLDPREVRNGLVQAGFQADLRSGFYGRPNGLAKRVVARFLDLAIAFLRGKGLVLAPFFLIHGHGDMSPYKRPTAVPAAPERAVEPTEVPV